MLNEFLRWTVLSLTISLMLFSVAAIATETEYHLPPPPIHKFVDSLGIDMISRIPGPGGMTVSIGTKDSGIASLPGRNRTIQDNHTGTITEIKIYSQSNHNPSISGFAVGTYIRVDALGESEYFRETAGSYSNYKNTGGSLSCDSNFCTYTERSGVVAIFDKSRPTNYKIIYPCGCTSSVGDTNTIPDGSTSLHKNIGQITEVRHNDGEIITYTYISITGFGGNVISAVSSSLGWMLKYYFSDFSSVNNPSAGISSTQNRSIVAINRSVEYCDPLARACGSLQSNWPKSSMTVSSTIVFSSTAVPTYTSRTVNTSVTNALGYSDSYKVEDPVMPYPENSYRTFADIVYTFKKGGTSYYAQVPTDTSNFNQVKELIIGGPHLGGQYTFSYAPGSAPDGFYKVNQSRKYPEAYTDKLGRRYSYTYVDPWGTKLDKLIDPDATPSFDSATGGYTDYDYDSRGNIIAIKVYPKNGGTPLISSATYPSACDNTKTCNKPISTTDQKGVTYSYTYDPDHGGIMSITKPAVNNVQAQVNYHYELKTPYIKNSSGNLVASTPVWRLVKISQCMTMTLNSCEGTEDELVTEFSDFTNNVLPRVTTTRNGVHTLSLATTTEYDIYGNISWVDGPRPGEYDRIYYFYDAMRQKIGEIGADPDGLGILSRQATRTSYNGDGKITSVEKGVVSGVTKSELDSMQIKEKLTTQYSSIHGLPEVTRYYTNGLKRVVQTSYDEELQVECIAERMNRLDNAHYYSACELSSSGDEGEDRITKYSYDAAGAVLSVIRAYGTSLQRVERASTYYPENGLLATETDGKGNTTFYKYDDYKRLWKTVYPQVSNGASESLTDYTQTNYQSGSALVSSIRLRDGLTINFNAYDALGRLKSKSGAVSESFSYNNFDQVVTRTNNTTGGVSQTSNYNFNALGWLKHESRAAGGVALGNVSYGYDDYGRKTRLTWPDGFYINYDYQTNGYMGDYLKTISQSDGTLLASYDYHENGLRKTLTRGNGVVTNYDYYPSRQLKSLETDVGGIATTDDINETFAYTVAGQLKARTSTINNSGYIFPITSTSTVNYMPNALNQIAAANNATFTYDGRGNLKTDDNGYSYTYSANNLLLNATKSGVVASLSYDAENRLYSIVKSGSTTKFMYDGADLIAETNSSNTITRRYVHGPGTDDPIVWFEGSGANDKRYYTYDRQGSILGITKSDGTSLMIGAYDEYGNQSNPGIGRFQYTGQTWLPEVGLYYYKARLYNPRFGRFLQTDPVGYKDQMNLYAYVYNDPMNFTDPTGKYGRGEGWTERQWKKFDKAQKSAAKKMNSKAARLEKKAAKLDKKGKDGGDNLRTAASNLRKGADALNSDGSDGKLAYAGSASAGTWTRSGDVAGFVNGAGGNTVIVNVDHAAFKAGGEAFKRVLTHESLHTGGLSDWTRGARAYCCSGQQDHLNHYNSLTPEEKVNNPDYLMEMVW